MPQTTVIPAWKAEVPILTPAQKPGGVTISTTLIANAVPNKPQPWTSTMITDAGLEAAEEELTTMSAGPMSAEPMMARASVAQVDEPEEEETEEDEDEPPPTHHTRTRRKR